MRRSSTNINTVRLQKLDDVNVRKLQALGRWDRDTHDAIVWLRNNRDKFKMEVFEPPIMVLTVPDKRFVNAVESCFNAPQLKVSGHPWGSPALPLLRLPDSRHSLHNAKRIWIRSITTSTIVRLLEGRHVSPLGTALAKKTCCRLHL